MHLYCRNVNDALTDLMNGFHTGIFNTSIPYRANRTVKDKDALHLTEYLWEPPLAKTATRAGTCLTIQEPVIITYMNPAERVLFNQHRDANPFFHLVEALWVLAGRNDIASLMYYNSKVADFSDDGKTWWGAYGRRLRCAPNDQIADAIAILRDQRNTRRVVLETWRPYDLNLVLHKPECRDVPCNTEIMLGIRSANAGPGVQPGSYLDMTVINRSNDTIWGALGSNYVTFSILQAYIACAVGCMQGVYNQMSNNLHVYILESGPTPEEKTPTNIFNPEVLLKERWTATNAYGPYDMFPGTIPNSTDVLDADLALLFDRPAIDHWTTLFNNDFMVSTVGPMLRAWNSHKKKDYSGAKIHATAIKSADWRHACQQWLRKRHLATKQG